MYQNQKNEGSFISRKFEKIGIEELNKIPSSIKFVSVDQTEDDGLNEGAKLPSPWVKTLVVYDQVNGARKAQGVEDGSLVLSGDLVSTDTIQLNHQNKIAGVNPVLITPVASLLGQTPTGKPTCNWYVVLWTQHGGLFVSVPLAGPRLTSTQKVLNELENIRMQEKKSFTKTLQMWTTQYFDKSRGKAFWMFEYFGGDKGSIWLDTPTDKIDSCNLVKKSMIAWKAQKAKQPAQQPMQYGQQMPYGQPYAQRMPYGQPMQYDQPYAQHMPYGQPMQYGQPPVPPAFMRPPQAQMPGQDEDI